MMIIIYRDNLFLIFTTVTRSKTHFFTATAHKWRCSL